MSTRDAFSRRGREPRGFTLVETLIAVFVFTVGAAGVAQLFLMAGASNRGARATTMTMMLARGKLEQLRGLAWAVDAAGAPIADATADIAVVPEQPHGGTGVSPSPAGTLGRNTPGYCDFLDASGRPVAPGLDASEPPGGAVYIRRWAVTPLDTSPADTLVLQVLVTTRRDRGAADVTTRVERLPDEARIVAVKTRKRG